MLGEWVKERPGQWLWLHRRWNGFMKILAIDTASWNCSVALWEDGQELAFQEKKSERDQAALLPQLVKEVMGQHKVDQLIVNIGPGSFTGIRVGLAFAKGFAMGLRSSFKRN